MRRNAFLNTLRRWESLVLVGVVMTMVMLLVVGGSALDYEKLRFMERQQQVTPRSSPREPQDHTLNVRGNEANL